MSGRAWALVLLVLAQLRDGVGAERHDTRAVRLRWPPIFGVVVDDRGSSCLAMVTVPVSRSTSAHRNPSSSDLRAHSTVDGQRKERRRLWPRLLRGGQKLARVVDRPAVLACTVTLVFARSRSIFDSGRRIDDEQLVADRNLERASSLECAVDDGVKHVHAARRQFHRRVERLQIRSSNLRPSVCRREIDGRSSAIRLDCAINTAPGV